MTAHTKRPIVPVSLREQVYRNLCDAIMRGEYAPGDILKISAIAEESGTSLVPVREALQNLAAEGAIEMLHNRSARIPKMSLLDFQQLTSIRLNLEGMAAATAAPNLTDHDLIELDRLNSEMVSAVAHNDRPTILLRNQEFHFLLYKLAGSPMLSRLIRILWLRAGPILNASLTGDVDGIELHSAALKEHNAILASANARDGQRLSQAIVTDIDHAHDWYVRNFDFS